MERLPTSDSITQKEKTMNYFALAVCLFSCTPNLSSPLKTPILSVNANSTDTVSSPTPEPTIGWFYDSTVLANLTPAMIASNPQDLCPNYLGNEYHFWIAFIKSVAFAESSWNRISKQEESGIGGVDPVTGVTVESVGLMQISYGDQRNYKSARICQEMDYDADRGLSPLIQTITDPEINIGCAMEIMDTLVRKYPGNMITALGKYWSTVRPGAMPMRKQLKIEAPWCYPQKIDDWLLRYKRRRSLGRPVAA